MKFWLKYEKSETALDCVRIFEVIKFLWKKVRNLRHKEYYIIVVLLSSNFVYDYSFTCGLYFNNIDVLYDFRHIQLWHSSTFSVSRNTRFYSLLQHQWPQHSWKHNHKSKYMIYLINFRMFDLVLKLNNFTLFEMKRLLKK